jgi:hypothetical protein
VTMVRRAALLFLRTYVVTVMLYLSLWALAAKRVDPVRFIAPLPGAALVFRQHGQPIFSGIGAGVWMFVIAVYVLVCVSFVRQANIVGTRTFAAVAVASAAVVALVHPLLVPLLLPTHWRMPYVQFLAAIHSPVGASQIGLNLTALVTAVSLAQALIVYCILDRSGETCL